MQGTQVRSLVRDLDPTCWHSQINNHFPKKQNIGEGGPIQVCGKQEAAFLQQGNKQRKNYKRCTHTHNLTLQSKILNGRIVY